MQKYKREVKNTSSCDLNVACSMQDSPHNVMFARKHCIILLDKMCNDTKLQYANWEKHFKRYFIASAWL